MSAAVSLPKVHLRVLTNSELRTARSCLRRHHYGYVLRRRPRTVGDALRFGTLWHVGQEAWWKAEPTPAARLTAGVGAMREHDADPFHLVMAEELLVAYTARWGDEVWTAVAVEASFEMPLVNPETGSASRTFRIGGKLDVIITDGTDVVLMEHKTTASDIEEGSLYWKKVTTLDTQVSTYVAGARAAGFDVSKCIYDVVRKPGIRPLKATPVESRKYTKAGLLYANQREHDETPEEYRLRLREDINERPSRYFARGDVVRLEQDTKEHAFDTWQQSRLLKNAELASFAPRNPDACTQFGACPYLPVCSGEASIEDETLYRTAETAHEELESE